MLMVMLLLVLVVYSDCLHALSSTSLLTYFSHLHPRTATQCTPTGDLRRVAYTKHRSRTESPGPEGYRLSRRVRQGDLWPFTGAARTEIVACAAEKTPSDRRGYRLQGDGDGRQRRRNRRRPVAMVEEARDALALRGQHQLQ